MASTVAMRQTRQRQLVYDIVMERYDHPTADEVYLLARSRDAKISRGTVYRKLNQLAQTGKILQVKVPSPAAERFDWRLQPHYHLLCTECGKLCDADIPYDDKLDQTISQKTGFEVSRHRTVFEGVCRACQKKRNNSES